MSNNFLFLLPARLGDALMLTPALSLLKQLRPATTIDVLALSSLAASIYRNNPHVDRIYVEADMGDMDLPRYGLLIAAHRGNSGFEAIEKLKMPLLMIGPADQQQAQAQQAFDFIRDFFATGQEDLDFPDYQLYPDDADRAYADSLIPAGHSYVGLHLGCHGINRKRGIFPCRKKQHEKVWPLEYFVELAQRLMHAGHGIVITGGENERHLADAFQRQVPDSINLAGETSVLQLAACMRNLSAVVSSDTGAMHVACAMRTPLVALFGPTNVVRTGPYPQASFRRVLDAEVLSDLSPARVFAEIEALLA